MRSCGECSECCVILSIDHEELFKHANTPCEYLGSGCTGCTIYDDKPDVCNDFICAWKDSPYFSQDERPDKIGAIFRFVRPDGRAKGFSRMVMVNAKSLSDWRFSDLHHGPINYKAIEVAKRIAKMCPVILSPGGDILGPWDEEGNLLQTAKWVKDPDEAHRRKPEHDLSVTEEEIFNILGLI